jgi:hypothetical protein
MPFNIAEFSAQMSNRGFAKNNLFLATLSQVPTVMANLEADISTRELTFLCESVSVPGMNFEGIELKTQGFGKSEFRPTEFRMDSLRAIFMVDAKFGTLKFFHKWMQSISNFNTYSGYLYSDEAGKYPYEFEYKENYEGILEVYFYGGNNVDNIYAHTFGGVFPIAIGEITSSWSDQGAVMTVPIQFAFNKFKTDSLSLGSITSNFSRSNGFMTYISSINSYGQAINQLETPQSIQDLINTITNVNTIYRAL